jgi:molecular chaperone DnaK (HSP70)
MGGSDIDQWLLAEVLRRIGLEGQDLGNDYTPLLARCEQAKIALSAQEEAPLTFSISGQHYRLTLTRADLENLLEQHGFYAALRYVIEKVLTKARREGIFKEDIYHVLLVGGVSLMPSVQAVLREIFSDQAVHAGKPFTAVAEGALQIAQGYGLDDYLNHSYGIRHFSQDQHHYEEIIPAGTRYPMDKPVELILSASFPEQKAIELVIGEISSDSTPLIEVEYENGQAVFVSKVDEDEQQITVLNAEKPTLIYLTPAGKPGKERIKASFWIDARRTLRVNATDLKTHENLLDNEIVATLR